MSAKIARVWTGTEWVNVSSPVITGNSVVTYQTSAPASPITGQVWINDTTRVLSVWTGSAWVATSISASDISTGTLAVARGGTGTTTSTGSGSVVLSGSPTITSPSISSATLSNQTIVAAGSASAPSIAPTGDTNTGIFFPAADTIAFSEGGTEAMRIDSAGRITMPSKPMFMGFPTTDYSGGSMPAGVIAFTASYNNGSHFNTSNNRFIAPINGWYRVSWGGLQLQATVTSLRVNGVRTYNGNHWAGTGPSYINMTQTVVRSLSANDYLEIEGWNGGGYYSGWYLWTVEQIA